MCGAVATNIPRLPSLTFAGEKLLRAWSCFYSLGRTLMISPREGWGRKGSFHCICAVQRPFVRFPRRAINVHVG